MYKNYKQLFETIKKVHFSNLITQYKYNIKKTWALIREAIGKEEMKKRTFLKKISKKLLTVFAKNFHHRLLIGL